MSNSENAYKFEIDIANGHGMRTWHMDMVQGHWWKNAIDLTCVSSGKRTKFAMCYLRQIN